VKGTWLTELNYSEVKWRFQPKSGKDFHGETLPIKKESYKKVEIRPKDSQIINLERDRI